MNRFDLPFCIAATASIQFTAKAAVRRGNGRRSGKMHARSILMRALQFTTYCGLGALASGVAQATTVVTTEIRSHFAPDNVGTGLIVNPPFTLIPNLRSDDYADSHSGHGVTVTVLDGVLNFDSGPPSRLNNGAWQPTSDDPANSTFFENFNNGKFLFNLNGVVNVTEVNSYSRHVDGRTPQWYSLYASNQTQAPSTTGDLAANGWQSIATVNMRSQFEAFNGVAGANVRDDSGSLGNFRYMLFDIHGVGSDGGFGTFYSEIDIVGAAVVPEPSGLVLVALGLAGFAVWSWQKRKR